VILIGRDSYFTQGTRTETLCQKPYDSSRASALKQTREKKPCQTLKDSDKASVPELRGGLSTGREALQPSEPCHSLNKAFQVEFPKCGVCVCVLISNGMGYLWGHVGAPLTWPSNNSPSAGRPGGMASTTFLPRRGLRCLM
jgi:hypothetical protein